MANTETLPPLAETVLKLRGAKQNLMEALELNDSNLIKSERINLIHVLNTYKISLKSYRKDSIIIRYLLKAGTLEAKAAESMLDKASQALSSYIRAL